MYGAKKVDPITLACYHECAYLRLSSMRDLTGIKTLSRVDRLHDHKVLTSAAGLLHLPGLLRVRGSLGLSAAVSEHVVTYTQAWSIAQHAPYSLIRMSSIPRFLEVS